MLDDPIPINFGNAGCPAMVRRGAGQWGSCPGEPTHAGFVDHAAGYRPGVRFRVFPCDRHTGQVDDPAPMTDDDRAELEHRREQVRLAMAGKPYDRPGRC
jgi:hypothetical protein